MSFVSFRQSPKFCTFLLTSVIDSLHLVPCLSHSRAPGSRQAQGVSVQSHTGGNQRCLSCSLPLELLISAFERYQWFPNSTELCPQSVSKRQVPGLHACWATGSGQGQITIFFNTILSVSKAHPGLRATAQNNFQQELLLSLQMVSMMGLWPLPAGREFCRYLCIQGVCF